MNAYILIARRYRTNVLDVVAVSVTEQGHQQRLSQLDREKYVNGLGITLDEGETLEDAKAFYLKEMGKNRWNNNIDASRMLDIHGSFVWS